MEQKYKLFRIPPYCQLGNALKLILIAVLVLGVRSGFVLDRFDSSSTVKIYFVALMHD